jgi:cell division septum initiation protein DivIVA
MSIRDEEAPAFSHSLRGYDRVQVDEYVAGFREYAIQVEDRAVAAESALVECRRELASPGSGGISERLAAILQLANEEADEIRARVKAEGEAMTEQATSEAERTVREANEQRGAIQAEIDDLSAVRERLLERLVELGDEIRDAMARFQEYLPGVAPTARVEAVLFDAEAVEEAEALEEEGAVQAEPVPDSEADTQLMTSTGQTPEP